MKERAKQIHIISEADDGTIEAWNEYSDGWYQVKARDGQLISLIRSPWRDAMPPFLKPCTLKVNGQAIQSYTNHQKGE